VVRSLRGGAAGEGWGRGFGSLCERGQPPEDRAAGRAHEMRVWATDDVFTALTSEARERGWTLSRVIEALLIEVTKTRARVAELEKKR